jgi:hypothetical protein
MFAVFSLIENIPTIHKIYKSEETTQKSMSDFVISYIQQKRSNEDKNPLTVQLNEIKPESFSFYPIQTYLSIDSNLIEIYEHSLSEKIEKGWVWNGTLKVVQSKKVGSFHVLKSPFEDDEQSQPNEQQSLISLTSEMDELINEIINEISDTRISLEKDIEDVKKLQFDIDLDFPNQDSLSSTSLPFTAALPQTSIIDYSRIEYPFQPSSGGFTKRNLVSFEEKYLPFESVNWEEKDENSEKDQNSEKEENSETKEEEIVNTSEEKDEDNNNFYTTKCRSSRRGARASQGRSNVMRKMRIRSW